ncbi:IS110 family transposase [Solihabitans fulvus]|uniref:IS110 family transposase n=1 Tax=Solihabitans fulvus TaxID=1892852 RepID=UPI001F0B10EC|nr:transposase [Solihabitans fulvus]
MDTHHDTHHAAIVRLSGRRVTDLEFPTTTAGHTALLAWARSHGRVHAAGIEGTNSYGAGLTRHLHAAGITVVEVNQPDRRQRRQHGKPDPLDAYAAADAVMSQRASAAPKLGTGIAEAVRALHTTRAGAVKTRTATANQLKSLLVTAPGSATSSGP